MMTDVSVKLWGRRILSGILASISVALFWLISIGTPPALATLNDDTFDGNIFALYGGNGSLVPPRVKLTDSLQRKKPALLVFYVEDSMDCKQFAIVVSQLQAFYGRAADLLPINIDAILPTVKYTAQEPGYYYKGIVPQTVLIDQEGKVALDVKGQVPFEKIDDKFREVFDLLPRAESKDLKRRSVNEINVELVPG